MENKFNNQGKCNNSQVGTLSLSLSGNPTELRIIKSGPQKRKIKEAKYNQEERDNQLVFGPDGDAIQIWIVFLRRKSQRGGGPIWFFIPIDWHSNAVVIVVVIVKRWRHKRRCGPLHPPHHHQQISYLFIPIFFFFFSVQIKYLVSSSPSFSFQHTPKRSPSLSTVSQWWARSCKDFSLSLLYFLFFLLNCFFSSVCRRGRACHAKLLFPPLGKIVRSKIKKRGEDQSKRTWNKNIGRKKKSRTQTNSTKN